ncbi:unnamed protein product [Gulo gulo]|uniref:Agouti signaling protein n=1 Tax=Gulo gulo TaxID=48420 RepID=A0A9X9LKM4_GULGU|nr:unnamed protein product [Gulo gulo]
MFFVFALALCSWPSRVYLPPKPVERETSLPLDTLIPSQNLVNNDKEKTENTFQMK